MRPCRYVQIYHIQGYSTIILYVSDRLVTIKETQTGSRWLLKFIFQRIFPACRHCQRQHFLRTHLYFVPGRLLYALAVVILRFRPPYMLSLMLPYALRYHLTSSKFTT